MWRVRGRARYLRDMTVYSKRLGEITDAQFDAALRRAGLGRFVAAEAISQGLFGQNVFLTSTEGRFVFRGAPHWHDGKQDDAWQFPKERLYAERLHATGAPVAWPQVLDDAGDLFPWPYLIMPRLPGLCVANDLKALAREDWPKVARAVGEALAGLQRLTHPVAGDFDPAAQAIAPFEDGYVAHLVRQIQTLIREGEADGALTGADVAWIEALIGADDGNEPPAVYVHNDFSLGNVLVERHGEGWRVSGVVDLMTSCFGDGCADFARLAGQFIQGGGPHAATFLAGYREAGGAARPAPARLALVTAVERLLIWNYFRRQSPAWLEGHTFRSWAEPYVEALAAAWQAAA
ncbi:MAG TPA: phosphotransferase [Caulobacteraceae bacterium]|nr:phosphotransferase [Caulobacteraceae bacterium]